MRVVLSRASAARHSGRSEWASATTSKRSDSVAKGAFGRLFFMPDLLVNRHNIL